MDNTITESYKFTLAEQHSTFVGYKLSQTKSRYFLIFSGLDKKGNPLFVESSTERVCVVSTPTYCKNMIRLGCEPALGFHFPARPSKKYGGYFIKDLKVVICEKYDPNKVYYDEWSSQ